MSNSENIAFHCPACGSKLTVPSHLAGVTGPCPYCQSEIAAPHPAEGTDARLIRASDRVAGPPPSSPPPAREPEPTVTTPPSEGPERSATGPTTAGPVSPPSGQGSGGATQPGSEPEPEPPAAAQLPSAPSQPIADDSSAGLGPTASADLLPEQPATPPEGGAPSSPVVPAEAPDSPGPGPRPVGERDRAGRSSRKPRSRRGLPIAPVVVLLVVLAAAAGGYYYWAFLRPNAAGPDPGMPPALGNENGDGTGAERASPSNPRTDQGGASVADHGGIEPAALPSTPSSGTPGGDPEIDPDTASLIRNAVPRERPMPLDPGSTNLVPEGAIPGDPAASALSGVADAGGTLPPPSGTGFGSSSEGEGEPVDASILAGPRDALTRFLEASNWEERGAYIQNPAENLPKLKKYHEETESPDGPVKATSVTFQNSERVPNSDYHFFLFHVATEAVPDGFPVSVEETPEGFRVDWEAFIEFHDLLLYKFMETPQPGARAFHVIMRRAHYFGSDVPDIDRKYSFRIEPPIPGYEGFAFVSKDSPLVEDKLSHQLQWPAISYPIVKLRWAEEGDSRFIEIVDVVQNTWRSDGGAPSAEPTGAASASR